METSIIYKYRAPEAPPGNDSTIAAKILDLTPEEVLRTFHKEGESFMLQADTPEEFGEEPKEYRVLSHGSSLSQWGGELGVSLAVLLVIVTDPDS